MLELRVLEHNTENVWDTIQNDQHIKAKGNMTNSQVKRQFVDGNPS